MEAPSRAFTAAASDTVEMAFLGAPMTTLRENARMSTSEETSPRILWGVVAEVVSTRRMSIKNSDSCFYTLKASIKWRVRNSDDPDVISLVG